MRQPEILIPYTASETLGVQTNWPDSAVQAWIGVDR
jgi:hypothetical protein